MRLVGKTILIDLMPGQDTTPITPILTKRFSDSTLKLIDDFLEIDLLLLTHDHLDYSSIQKLKAKTKKSYANLGIKRHLISWGVEENLIREFDWWQEGTSEDDNHVNPYQAFLWKKPNRSFKNTLGWLGL